METPSTAPQQESDAFDEENEADRAYRAIQAQMDLWTSPRVTTNSPWTNASTTQIMDDDDDDGLVFTSKINTSTSANSTSKSSSLTLPLSSAAKSSAARTPSAYPYERNPMDWWNRELVAPEPKDDDDDDDEITSASNRKLRVTRTNTPAAAGATPAGMMMSSPAKQRGTPTVERASTPIMSNSSKKKTKRNKYGLAGSSAIKGPLLRHLEEVDDDEDDDDAAVAEDEEIMPVNVQSPWVRQQQESDSMPLRTKHGSPWGSATPGRGIFGSSAPTTPRAISPFRSQQYEYRRYHDALLTYYKARRSLSDRIAMDREEQALSLMDDGENNNPGTALALLHQPSGDLKLTQEETLIELDFLRTLKSLCWERDSPSSQKCRDWRSRREGNFWALMGELRAVGFAAMLWADDEASMRQNAQVQRVFWENTATQIHSTPKELLEKMIGEEAPLALKRRKHILTWIENCLDQIVPAETKASVSMAGGKDSAILSNLGPRSRHLDKVLQSCLALILAGRLKDAKLLLRKAGHPLIAAQLGGGAPAGVEKVVYDDIESVEQVKVGNINRPLWKRQMWKLSEKLSRGESGVTSEEVAVYSFLANDYHNALENPALRSWEQGLNVLLHATWDRTEDELLLLHNNNRRKTQPPFPGTQYEQQEREQLQATCELSNITEIGIVEMLAGSPFEEMKGNDPLCCAIASLLVGCTTLTDFLGDETDMLASNSIADDELDAKVFRLRFITHLLLYLDSLSASTTPVDLNSINEYKNRALYAYLDHLASHEDLWHFVVLYASLLPEEVLVDCIPSILVRVEGREERSMMIQQSRELFPTRGLDLTILRIVVRLMLGEEDETMMSTEEDEADKSTTPTGSDIRKMKSIQWLCFYEEHMGDALIAANMLLRQFLMANKFASAVMFLHDFLPSEVVERVMASTDFPIKDDDDEDAIIENELYQANVGKARAEHIAYQSYLKAFRAAEEWSLVISSTPFSKTEVDDKVDASVLKESEQAIAKSMDRRELIRQKRRISQIIVEAAETARKDAMSVLLHDGGWLADSDDAVGGRGTSAEDLQRKQEILSLRSRLLPYTVKMLLRINEETADWMFSSLLDACPDLGSTPNEVLEALDDGRALSEGGLSPLSPRKWTQQALNLAETVSSDEHLVLQAFDATELKEMLGKMSEIALQDLTYSA